MKRKFDLSAFLVNLIVPLAVGGLSAILTSGSMKAFEKMDKPPLAPPSWLFPVIWTALYILMGISAYLVWKNHPLFYMREFSVYVLQLTVNFLWPLVFFGGGAYMAALVLLILLLILVVIMTVLFWKRKKAAGILQLPYILWLLIAAYLNLGIYMLNR